jgi:two-component system response regulator MprA
MPEPAPAQRDGTRDTPQALPAASAHSAARDRDVLIADADRSACERLTTDRSACERLTTDLAAEGFAATAVHDGMAVLEHLAHARPAALVLDAALPRLDGLSITRRLRQVDDSPPALMLTELRAVAARVDALQAGADDCMSKPAHPAELAARLRALLRRTGWRKPDDLPTALTYEDLRMDLRTRDVHRGRRHVLLTHTESALLEAFLNHPYRVLTRQQIHEAVWGPEAEWTSNNLEVYVSTLRRKIENSVEPRLLHTVRGVGYVLRAHR